MLQTIFSFWGYVVIAVIIILAAYLFIGFLFTSYVFPAAEKMVDYIIKAIGVEFFSIDGSDEVTDKTMILVLFYLWPIMLIALMLVFIAYLIKVFFNKTSIKLHNLVVSSAKKHLS